MSWLYACTIYPLQLFYKYVYLACIRLTGSYGIGLIGLSLVCAVAFVPLGRMAKKAKWKEDDLQDVMRPQISKIKAEYTGAERQDAITRLYKRYSYNPLMSLRSAIGVLLQLPFLTAAYRMVQELTVLKGQSFWIIKDLSIPDSLCGGVNVLPIVMTLINFATIATTPNMRNKERIQAVVIALLFLWLLYGAPSALLVYWSCNNLNYLVQNFVFRGNNNPRVGRERPSFIMEEPDVFLGILLGVTTFCVFIPSSLFLANINEFLVGFAEIVPILLFASVLTTIILVSFMRGIRGSMAFRVLAALGLGAGVALFLQAHFLNPPLPVLNGTKINWGQYGTYTVLSTAVWLLCLVAPLIVELKNTVLSKRIRKGISLFLIVLQTVFLIVAVSTTTKTRNTGGWVITKNGEFELSKSKNTIVIMIDTLDAQWFEQVVLPDKSLCLKLKDFTYFNNIVAGGAPTDMGMPLLYTGKLYDGTISRHAYYEKAFSESTLFSDLKRDGCSLKLFTEPKCLVGADVDNIDNIQRGQKYHISSLSSFAYYLYRLVAFNSMPQFLKPLLEFYGNNLTQLVATEGVSTYIVDDPQFYKDLTTEGLSVGKDTAERGLYLYQLFGAHGYYTMNENCERIPEQRTHEAWRNQILGSFKIAFTFIDYMKSIGLYDDSTFIITADHGGVQLYQNPAVLIKLPGTRNQMTINDAPGTFIELRATIAASLLRSAEKYGKTLFDLTSSDNKIRLHAAPKILGHALFPNDRTVSNKPYVQYALSGNIRKRQNIRVYLGALQKGHEYDLGKVLSFSAADTINSAYSFMVAGFSTEEQNFTWTDGHKAQMAFKLPHSSSGKNLLCTLEHGTYASKQRVIVKANNHVVLEYIAMGQQHKEFIIPAELLGNDELLLTFSLPDAVSPKQRVESGDARKLALSMKSLCIREYHPTDYALGVPLSFKSAGGNMAKLYILRGFSGAEKNFTWTDGHEALIAFKLPHDLAGKELVCRFEHGTYAGKQHVTVKANGTSVLEYEARDQHKKEFIIPSTLLKNDELVLTFILPDAISPYQRGESDDPRLLALAMQSLCITAVE